MSTKHVLSGGCEKSVAFLFAGLLVCFCVCVFFNQRFNESSTFKPLYSWIQSTSSQTTSFRFNKGTFVTLNLTSSFRPSLQPCSCSSDSFLGQICKAFSLLCYLLTNSAEISKISASANYLCNPEKTRTHFENSNRVYLWWKMRIESSSFVRFY